MRLGVREHELLAAAAQRAGLTVAGYCASASLAAARGGEAPGSPVRVALAELLAARSAVARVGANVNQIARASNAGVQPAWPQLEGYLRVLRSAAVRVEAAAEQVARSVR